MTQNDSPTARRVIAVITVVVCLAVFVVLRIGGSHSPTSIGATEGPPSPDSLATVNAILNGLSTMCLVGGYIAIRRKRVVVHRGFMIGAFVFSTCFLVTYLLHHARVGSVPFPGSGASKAIYLAVLVPHVLLAATIIPLALFTVTRALKNDISAHRSIARKTLPLWLYVATSGVGLYFMLYHGG